jgi:hypothetical protein
MASDEDVPAIDLIGEMPAREREQETGQEERETGEPERECLSGDVVNLPANRHGQHLRGDDQ